MEISNELLNQVLKEEVNESIILDGYIIKYSYKYLGYAEINIYELAHKCKEWAFKQGFEIVVMAYSIKIYRNAYEVYNTNTTLFDLDMFFKSCEWILDNKPL